MCCTFKTGNIDYISLPTFEISRHIKGRAAFPMSFGRIYRYYREMLAHL